MTIQKEASAASFKKALGYKPVAKGESSAVASVLGRLLGGYGGARLGAEAGKRLASGGSLGGALSGAFTGQHLGGLAARRASASIRRSARAHNNKLLRAHLATGLTASAAAGVAATTGLSAAFSRKKKEAGVVGSIARALSPFPRSGSKAEHAANALGLLAPIPGARLAAIYATRLRGLHTGRLVSMPLKGVHTETGKKVVTNVAEIERALSSKKRLAVLKAFADKALGSATKAPSSATKAPMPGGFRY